MVTDLEKITIAKEYFKRVDAGQPDVLDLFTEDVQLFFPKFGIGKGKSALIEFGGGLMTAIESVVHDPQTYLYLPSGDHLTVEGTTRGVSGKGATWTGGETAGGRFCTVFAFRDCLIARMHTYLDPDYTGEDQDRFLWGKEGRSW